MRSSKTIHVISAHAEGEVGDFRTSSTGAAPTACMPVRRGVAVVGDRLTVVPPIGSMFTECILGTTLGDTPGFLPQPGDYRRTDRDAR